MSTARTIAALGVSLLVLAGCGTVKEKTAPCQRPADLTSFVADRRHDCGPMQAVNDPAAAFAAIGIIEPRDQ